LISSTAYLLLLEVELLDFDEPPFALSDLLLVLFEDSFSLPRLLDFVVGITLIFNV
jgi:hypothetical protein